MLGAPGGILRDPRGSEWDPSGLQGGFRGVHGLSIATGSCDLRLTFPGQPERSERPETLAPETRVPDLRTTTLEDLFGCVHHRAKSFAQFQGSHDLAAPGLRGLNLLTHRAGESRSTIKHNGCGGLIFGPRSNNILLLSSGWSLINPPGPSQKFC